jgi:CO/xanthine dehydrogenase FAD-binding subunit
MAPAAPGPGPVVLAGGTDLWPLWTTEGSCPSQVLSLHRIRELRVIEEQEGKLRIGATCTHTDLIRSALVRRSSPALAEAAATVGAAQIQNRGTIGGNIVNGSPAADLPPPLAAAEAVLELASTRGRRQVPLSGFFTGYRATVRREDELLVAVEVPLLPKGALERFRKVGTRRAQAISKVVGACRIALDADDGTIASVGIAFGSVAPTVLRLPELERWLTGRPPDRETAAEAESRAVTAVKPIDDLRSSAAYREHVVGRLVRRWIEEAQAG